MSLRKLHFKQTSGGDGIPAELFHILKDDFRILFLAVLGLYCCTSFSLIAASGDSSLVAVCGLLLAATFLVAEHRLYGAQAQ